MDVLKGELIKLNKGCLPAEFGRFRYDFMQLIQGYNLNGGEDIIVGKPLIKSGKVKEVLTEVEFDAIYLKFDLLDSLFFKRENHNEYFMKKYTYESKSRYIETAVKLTDDNCSNVSSDMLKKYIDQHKDIKAYREYLEQLKIECHKMVLETLNTKLEGKDLKKADEKMVKMLVKSIKESKKSA